MNKGKAERTKMHGDAAGELLSLRNNQHTPRAYPLKEIKGYGKILPETPFILSFRRLRGTGLGYGEFFLDYQEQSSLKQCVT